MTPDPSPSGKRVRDHWFSEMESRTMPRTTATTGAIPHNVLPTVLDHCTPAIRGEDDDFHDPLCMYTVPPCVYKRGVGPLGRKQRFALLAEHIRSFEPRYWHSPQSTSPLAETWELPSLSPRLYPLLQAPPVQDSTVLSHTPLLDVRPHGRNQNKPVRYCIASCINIWDEEHVASLWQNRLNYPGSSA